MPVNRGQGQPTRWYQLCFVPINADSSDDSDTESVVLAPNTPTPTSTWQVSPSETPSPPQPRPPNPEPQIDWHFPPPPPPPPPLYLDATDEAFGNESRDDIYETPHPSDTFLDHNNTPTPTSTWQVSPSETPPPSQPRPPNPEPQMDWHFSPPPPPPPPLYLDATDEAFGSESQDDIYESPHPSDAFLDHNPLGSSSLIEQGQGWPETDKRNYPQVPDGIINSILRVRISEHDRDKLSLCPICMEELKVGYQACKLPCNHTYCSDCILLWLNNNKTCPLCRVRLDGGEGQGGSYSRGNNSLEPESPVIHTQSTWEFFFPSPPDSQSYYGE